MTELLTATQMRALEGAAIAAGTRSGLELMERAGRGVVDAIFDEWPDLAQTSHRAVVLCGPGNNGGDGFVVARLLKDWGWTVDVFLFGNADKLPADAKINCLRWMQMGKVQPMMDTSLQDYTALHPGTALVVDAIFGTGLTRPFCNLSTIQTELNRWKCAPAQHQTPRNVSVDIPSGLCSDSGRYLCNPDKNDFTPCVSDHLTVTFHTAKPGHYLAEGPAACGKLVVKDIGL